MWRGWTLGVRFGGERLGEGLCDGVRVLGEGNGVEGCGGGVAGVEGGHKKLGLDSLVVFFGWCTEEQSDEPVCDCTEDALVITDS